MIRTLIVDDEPLARQRLRALLTRKTDVDIVGECSDGPAAIAAIRELRPDLVLLDVQMPGCDGFGVLEALGDGPLPAVIFATAYDRYAVKAFEVHALDYLLKPFQPQRVQQAMQRARTQLADASTDAVQEQLRSLLRDLREPPRPAERLAVKVENEIILVRTADIDWIEAAGNYVRLHTAGKTHQLRETLAGLEARLDPQTFLRIHRSVMINVDRVRKLEPWFHGDYQVLLHDGTRLTLSRSYRSRVLQRLGCPS